VELFEPKVEENVMKLIETCSRHAHKVLAVKPSMVDSWGNHQYSKEVHTNRSKRYRVAKDSGS
jgi:hypothetical protein